MHWLRRGHLYFGLLMFPWAVLYGVTGFLFNHPQVLADRVTNSFGPEVLSGTPMATPVRPDELAGQVVAALQARAKDGEDYQLVRADEATYSRDSAFAIAKTPDANVNVLIDMWGRGVTIRSRPEVKKDEPARAPFAVGPNRQRRGGRPTPPAAAKPEGGLAIDQPLPDRIKAAVPAVLAHCGIAAGEVSVTSVPDLTFFMEGHGKTWAVTYSPMTGSVSGSADEVPPGESLTVRQFLLRLHLAHGYPDVGSPGWYWAVIVDVMAGVMVFWGVSGLLMWWQIKATRRLGLAIIAVSALAATLLGWGMHEVFAR